MRIGLFQSSFVRTCRGLCAVALLPAQEPPAGRGGGAGQGRGAGPPAQAPAVPQVARSPVVDQAAHDRGPGAVGEPLHRLPRLAGARFGHRSEHHPDEDGELRSQRRPGGQRPRTVPQGRPPDAEPEAERARSQTRRWSRWRTSCASASTTRCAARRCSRSATSSSAMPRPGRLLQRRRGVCHLPQRDGRATWRACRRAFPNRSICSSACSSPWAEDGTRPRRTWRPACRWR